MKADHFHIRPYRETDRAAVVELWQSTGLTMPHNDPNKDIDRKLKVDPDLFLVGEVKGSLVATAMAGYEGHRGWVNYLAVQPGLHGEGLGRLLMERVEALLKDRGCPKVNLQVRSSNADVIAFYQALGYVVDPAVSLGKRLIPDTD